MKKTFFLVSQGYTGGPSFSTLTAARAALRECVAAEKEACCRRYGFAFVKWFADGDGASVLIGKDAQAFNLWSRHAIAAE